MNVQSMTSPALLKRLAPTIQAQLCQHPAITIILMAEVGLCSSDDTASEPRVQL